MTPADVELSEADLRDARRYLRSGCRAEREAFARRQLATRNRLARVLTFYGRCPCRLARVHLLTSASVAVGRLCGYSETFNALGEFIMPVDAAGEVRSAAWARYRDACLGGRPPEVRDELWLAAHAADWRELRARGMDRAFFDEAAAHADDPTWRLLILHAELTLVSGRFGPHSGGGVPYETAIAPALGHAVRGLGSRGTPLLRHYVWETLRALLRPNTGARPGVVSDRRAAWEVLRSFVTSWGAVAVYRRGLRTANRGQDAPEADWPLLQTVLGDDVSKVHPLIVRFYTNPGRFRALAALEVDTLPLMLYSRVAALLLGQGLYEADQPLIDARLRVFRRADGSMHFVRELYCGESLRVFDSDFVLRTIDGKPTFVEVFDDLDAYVVLDVEPRPEGGVAVVGRDIYWKGHRLPRLGLKIEFTSRVLPGEADAVEVVGSLTLEPKTAWGRFLAYKILRRPRQLGRIRYLLHPDPG
jgi:hypothetical protein